VTGENLGLNSVTIERWRKTGKLYAWSRIPVEKGEVRALGFTPATAIREVSKEEFLDWCDGTNVPTLPSGATFWELSLD